MPLNPYDEFDPPPASPVGRALRTLAYIGSTLAGIGLFVSFEQDGAAVWPDGRLLLIAGGASFVVYGAWIARSAWPPERPEPPVTTRAIGIGFVLGGLAMIGGGVDHLDPDGPWLLLCLPAAAGFLIYAARHDEDRQVVVLTAALGLIAFAIAAIELI
jgi:peptidoglycan/LPS O-acetylase OafA/YrhL